jgi:uncharacterized protein YjbI with pentapeptide repeats
MGIVWRGKMSRRKIISGEEFVGKILNGERDFKNTRFLRRNKLDDRKTEGYKELRSYLFNLSDYEQKENPILLDGAYFSYVWLKGLWMPYVSAKKTIFNRCKIIDSVFEKGDFRDAIFKWTDLNKGTFDECLFEGAVLYPKVFYEGIESKGIGINNANYNIRENKKNYVIENGNLIFGG